ncbi:phospholipase D-like domain-containing protein [Oceanicoccus sagamiensis]|uniref:PLD phosphodiesterase domain-containing protein n=1 Tax=Oceanicoccus sagamiensis TaxID=716816 RepID=A0A1X9N4U7_9GAMM|nr:phosphatidylserine/phosphatidylglycerophosphate/cardiolipin synthase family protein [Oceanicoccus sagamiensis]ARN72756.1 hypothetical protein BST96_00680 [Oceanicoccus sagamiensis]
MGWESESVYSSPEAYYRALLLDINNATQTIELAVYIFTLDTLGQRFFDALVGAAGRGVRVCVQVDGIGSVDDGETLAASFARENIDCRIYHPLPWYLSAYRWSVTPGSFAGKLAHFILSLNRRDHRKFCVIDKQLAWCGSFNLCADHLAKTPPWRDYGVRLTGFAVALLRDNFYAVWERRPSVITPHDFRFLRCNNSRKLRRMRNRLLVQRIRLARERVWIVSAYFSPSGEVIRALKRARQAGMDVRVVVADRSDITVFPSLSATYYADLMTMGVAIYAYQAGILHAKAVLIDDECVMGSSNLNHRSFYHDLELDVLLASPQSVATVTELIEQDMADSVRASLDDLSVMSRRFWFGWLLRALRYWM